MQQNPVLEIKNLSLGVEIDNKIYPILKRINFSFFGGKIHAIVGESGCGKTMSVMSVLKLLPKNSKIVSGKIIYDNQNILEYNERQMRQIRGRKIALIPQDPMTSLNPLYTIENQLLEVIMLHNDITKDEALKVAIETLESVEFKDAKNRIKAYPHELSGGMKQRVIIAMALAAKADILIADEPTTALDVTIQAQILKLLNKIKEQGKTIILITHDLSIVYNYCDTATIMYLGDNVFASNKTVAAVRFPNTLIKIGNGAFFDADSIVDIDMPDSVIEIGDNVFTFCDSLSSVKISNGLNVIKENMFGLCNNLFTVTFGPNIKIIEDMAFLFNDKLNRIIFNGTVEQFNSIEFNTFWLGSVVKVICTDDVLQLR